MWSSTGLDVEKRDRKRSVSAVGIGLSQIVGLFWQLTQGNWPAYIHLVLQQKDPVPSWQGTDIAMALARCHMMHMLKQNKGDHIESKQEKTFPCKVISPAQTVRALYLFPGSRPILKWLRG